MMDWSDRHCRALHRQFTRRALLYTEMVTAPAVIHGDRARLLGFDACEHPVAIRRRWPNARGSQPISAMTRSTSMSAARRTGCSQAVSAPV